MLWKKLGERLDTVIYGLIGPFAILHIIPRYFLQIERDFGVDLPRLPWSRWVGSGLMVSGGMLAAWCMVLMYFRERGSANPFLRPTALVSSGPYRWVRHPMMWSINIVLAGEILLNSSMLILLWLLLWLRFAVRYIDLYEEPYLRTVFGQEYETYCRSTPRWIPRFKTRGAAEFAEGYELNKP